MEQDNESNPQDTLSIDSLPFWQNQFDAAIHSTIQLSFLDLNPIGISLHTPLKYNILLIIALDKNYMQKQLPLT